jgi:hypothetical protein
MGVFIAFSYFVFDDSKLYGLSGSTEIGFVNGKTGFIFG